MFLPYPRRTRKFTIFNKKG